MQWFKFARGLNSVVGASEVANELLAQDNKCVRLNLDEDLLPKLALLKGTGDVDGKWVNQRVARAWYLGARIGLRHVERGFKGWHLEEFEHALSCVVNYLTLPPRRRGFDLDSPWPIGQRRAVLAWLRPYWDKLIEAVCALDGLSQAHRDALHEQQLAVLLFLAHEESTREKKAATRAKSVTPLQVAKRANPDKVTVIQGEIPPSSDRSDADSLKRFEVLRESLPCKKLPPLEVLYAVQASLQSEFPWAQDAISVVMSDLLARKRHGVVRLGMAPIVLVGEPGTGKTRFAQRLGDLLDTPNMVINLAGMGDVKVLKGLARGWSSNRASRMVEFIQQTKVPNPLFILDEIDKARADSVNGGDPQDALLDLLEPGNAKRYHDVYLLAECDLSHCLYIATSNSLQALSEPLLSRLRPVLFPAPGREHTEVILRCIVRDLEVAWGLPAGAVTVSGQHAQLLQGLSAREMRRALLELLGQDVEAGRYALH